MLRGDQAIVLHGSPALRLNVVVFISTVGFSNEDTCCQSEGIGKLIKKALKGILRVNLLMSLQPTFFTRVLFGSFFPKSCLKVGGVAYTQVRLIHECLW